VSRCARLEGAMDGGRLTREIRARARLYFCRFYSCYLLRLSFLARARSLKERDSKTCCNLQFANEKVVSSLPQKMTKARIA
jgi:hypothetical protein